jgi:hypothetical protein
LQLSSPSLIDVKPLHGSSRPINIYMFLFSYCTKILTCCCSSSRSSFVFLGSFQKQKPSVF